MQRVVVFLNDRASASQSKNWKGELSQILFRSQVDFIASETFEEFQAAIKKAVEEKVDIIVSVGGDGTLNKVIQEIAGSETRCLILPAGTANDLANELKIPRHIQKAVECIRRETLAHIDIVRINGVAMATNGGIGIVSDVAANVNKLRRKVPFFKKVMALIHQRTYSVLLAAHLLGKVYRYYSLKIESSGFTGEVKTPLLLINNQPYLAKDFPVAPETRNTDGHFNVAIFLHPTWVSFIKTILKIKKGDYPRNDPNFISFETKEIRIFSSENTKLTFFGDGEHLVEASEIHVTIQKQSLWVFTPCLTEEL